MSSIIKQEPRNGFVQGLLFVLKAFPFWVFVLALLHMEFSKICILCTELVIA